MERSNGKSKAGLITKAVNHGNRKLCSDDDRQPDNEKDILEKVIVLSEAQNGILAAAEFDENAFRENIDEKAELIDKIERLDDGFNSLLQELRKLLTDIKMNTNQK